MHANATVTICHSKTRNLADVVRQADIVVAAIGRTALVTGDMVKPGAVVIDVGTNKVSDQGNSRAPFRARRDAVGGLSRSEAMSGPETWMSVASGKSPRC